MHRAWELFFKIKYGSCSSLQCLCARSRPDRLTRASADPTRRRDSTRGRGSPVRRLFGAPWHRRAGQWDCAAAAQAAVRRLTAWARPRARLGRGEKLAGRQPASFFFLLFPASFTVVSRCFSGPRGQRTCLVSQFFLKIHYEKEDFPSHQNAGTCMEY